MAYTIVIKIQSNFRLASLGLIVLWLTSGSAFAQRFGIVYSDPQPINFTINLPILSVSWRAGAGQNGGHTL